MEKIPTIFERDWDGNRGVINELKVTIPADAVATEKLDGTNVRLTVRNHTLVRLEKRRNPDKIQKQKGISEPWYVDADQYDPQDKHIWDAANNTLLNVADGEYSGEAVGPDVQGNPLNLDHNVVVLFSIEGMRQTLVHQNPGTDFEGLKHWLQNEKSVFGKDCGIEGIVWWLNGHPIGKIKLKDFKS